LALLAERKGERDRQDIDVHGRIAFPAGIAALGEKLRKAYTEEIEKRLAVLAAWRKADPVCYEPIGWFGKQVLRIEKSLGIRN
jgi:hypothetical protein